MLMTTDPGDLVLDPTCGSGTTAVVAEEWGRRWITCDTSRVALSLARTRIVGARLPYYLLKDSTEGRTKETELTRQPPPEDAAKGDIRQGFVYKRVPHVTLKAIANNEEIDAIHAKHQPELDRVRAVLNEGLKKPFEEWQLPREAPPEWSDAKREALAQWWTLRIARQKEIDASIAARADTEYLYDQPYEDTRRVRVAGPFTVESLSPHRVVPSRVGDLPESEREAQAKQGDGPFVTTVLDHLKKAGVQNGDRKQRLEFERLDRFAGRWIQASGESRTGLQVAVAIGPQFGTVGRALIDEARQEAESHKVFTVLVVCGMAFEPGVARDTSKDKGDDGFALTATEKRSKVEVFPVRVSPDLALADRLKNTGAGNLFMVFGEPDVQEARLADGRYTVTLRGVDVYDPSQGVVRSGTADGDALNDVACWMLDTAYDGRCFVVRHLYFPGRRDPYEKLKKALKAEIHADAWESLRGATSRPFARPASGIVAVKVINHYGDEVMKVLRLS
jgi:adenine-specific DNA-methyltransferase